MIATPFQALDGPIHACPGMEGLVPALMLALKGESTFVTLAAPPPDPSSLPPPRPPGRRAPEVGSNATPPSPVATKGLQHGSNSRE